MPYDKKPSAVTKMYDKKGKQVGLMVEGSAFHLDTDPENKGVTVTGDASKVGGKTVPTEAEKRAEKKKRLEEERAIARANLEMRRELAKETAKARRAERAIKLQQLKRKKEGKDYIDPATGKVVRRRVAGN